MASLEQLKKTLDMDPNFAQAHNQLQSLYRDTGRYDLWLEEWKKRASLSGDRDDLAMADEVARVYSRSGYKAAVVRNIELLRQLSKRKYVDPAVIA